MVFRIVTATVFITILIMDICWGIKDSCINGMCWNDQSYPFDEIKASYHSSDHYKETFGKLENFGGSRQDQPSHSLCKLRYSMKIQPLSIMDGPSKRFVLNTSKYKNEFTLNICDDRDQFESKCERQTCDPLNYEFVCKQKETRVQIMTYNLDNKQFEVHNLTYPSSCSCQAYVLKDLERCSNFK